MTTEKIKNELLNFYEKDNMEHSIAEFRKYLEIKGVKGFSPGQLSGAINQLYAKGDLKKTGRGIYRGSKTRYRSEDFDTEISAEWKKKIGICISKTEQEITETLNNVNILEVSENDFELLRDIKNNIQMLRDLKKKCL